MSSFLMALQFLTILPLKVKEVNPQKMATAMIYFPLVGLLLGFLLSVANALLNFFGFPALVINITLAVILITITAGIHLDGLADTADALLSGQPKDKMLEIMRDPHIGTMGVLSLISVILLKVGLFYSCAAQAKTVALLLACVLSRWSAVLAMFLFPYARKDGKAREFINGMTVKIFLISSIAAFVFSFAIRGWRGLLTLTIISGFTCIFGRFISRRIGGITGDTLGANIELTELIALFTVCIG